ncbi:MAG: acetylxylan esterase, partial [Armatimonadota bacterium]
MNPLEPYVPDDFDAFWTEAVAEAERAPLDYRRHPQSDVAGASGSVDLLTFRSITGDTLHGWFAYPDDGPSPAFLWVPPYSR